jgi:hypothetical protein
VLNNVPQFWHIDSISNWASQFGSLKLIALDYDSARALIEFCDSGCARAAYESEAIGFCPTLYACYWERPRDALAPVLPPTDGQPPSVLPRMSFHNANWSGNSGGSPPLSPSLTEAYSETADMDISVLTSQHTLPLGREALAGDYVPSTSSRPDEGCTQGVIKVSGDVPGSQGLVEEDNLSIQEANPPPSPTCTEGYSDDGDRGLPTPAYWLSCQMERKLQRQATLAEVKSFSLEVDSILRGVEVGFILESL